MLAALEKDANHDVRIALWSESDEPAVLRKLCLVGVLARRVSETVCAEPVLPAISIPAMCALGAVPSGSNTAPSHP